MIRHPLANKTRYSHRVYFRTFRWISFFRPFGRIRFITFRRLGPFGAFGRIQLISNISHFGRFGFRVGFGFGLRSLRVKITHRGQLFFLTSYSMITFSNAVLHPVKTVSTSPEYFLLLHVSIYLEIANMNSGSTNINSSLLF